MQINVAFPGSGRPFLPSSLLADPDVHAVDHRIEGPQEYAELRREPDPLTSPRSWLARALRARVSVIAAEDVPPDALRVTYKVTIEIEGGKRPACVAEGDRSALSLNCLPPNKLLLAPCQSAKLRARPAQPL